jgi:hypothetical protein
MDATKANTILATLRVLFNEVSSLQGSAAIQKLIEHGPLAQATQAAEHERHALDTIAMMTRLLEAEVLAIDDFGPWYQSLDELVFRSARLVLLTQLSHLQALITDIQHHTPTAHMPQQAQYRLKKWLDRVDILSALQSELRRVDEKWTPYRSASAHPSRTTAIFYRAGVSMAQFSIRELGRNQVIAKFFRDGACIDHAVAQRQCETVLGVLELEINTIPDDLVNLQQLAVKQVSSNHDPGFDEDRPRGQRVGDRR